MPAMKFKPKPQTVSRIALVFLTLVILAAILVFQFAGPMPSIFQRNLGAGTSFIPGWIAICDGYNIETHKFGQCTALIDCVYGKMKQVEVADAAIGGTIAGLLPTILILLGTITHTLLHLDCISDTCLAPPPKELVQQGLVSPHRAIALSCFCIGLPLGVLFQDLGPTRERSSARASTGGGGVVRWELHFAALSSTRWRHIHVLAKIGGDIVILACMGVVLWKAWDINQAVMVPWKCETPAMTFSWTVACMLWVVVALLLLHSMVEDIYFEDLTDSGIKYPWWEVWLLPYTLRSNNSKNRTAKVSGIAVVWKMPEGSWIRNQLVYDCVIEALAAVVYVYGTLVWLSALFLGATSALKYVSLTVALYAVARIVSGIL